MVRAQESATDRVPAAAQAEVVEELDSSRIAQQRGYMNARQHVRDSRVGGADLRAILPPNLIHATHSAAAKKIPPQSSPDTQPRDWRQFPDRHLEQLRLSIAGQRDGSAIHRDVAALIVRDQDRTRHVGNRGQDRLRAFAERAGRPPSLRLELQQRALELRDDAKVRRRLSTRSQRLAPCGHAVIIDRRRVTAILISPTGEPRPVSIRSAPVRSRRRAGRARSAAEPRDRSSGVPPCGTAPTNRQTASTRE